MDVAILAPLPVQVADAEFCCSLYFGIQDFIGTEIDGFDVSLSVGCFDSGFFFFTTLEFDMYWACPFRVKFGRWDD